MNFEICELGDAFVAEVSKDTGLSTVQEALDLIANAGYAGASQIVLFEESLAAEFFDLKTGLAGEIVQKFANYRMGLVIVGRFERHESSSLRAFVAESNRGNQVSFVADLDEARSALERRLGRQGS